MSRRPEYRLFDAGSVALAAFICSPLAGTILMAVNYRRLGKAGKGLLAVLFGLMATVPAIVIQWNARTLAGSLAAGALELLLFFCTWQIAIEVQGEAVEEHLAAGGKPGTKPAALFVGIATLAVAVGVTYVALYETQHRKVVMFGSKDQVVYSGLATRGTAMALGKALMVSQYFQDRGAAVLLDKGMGSRTISFGVQDDVWNQAGMMSSFEELGRQVAPTVGGLPVEVQLLDSKGVVEATSTVGEVRFRGNDGVFYEGLATEDEAEAVGEHLKSTGFFRGRGVNLILTRHAGEGTTIVFPVGPGVEENPAKVSNFEGVVREVAPMVGGLPIEMHLVDQRLVLKKDELVE